MPNKLVYAALEDLVKLREELLPLVEEIRGEIAPAVKAAETRLQTALKGLYDQVSSDKEEVNKTIVKESTVQKGALDATAKELRAEMAKIAPPLDASLKSSFKILEDQVLKVSEQAKVELHDSISEIARGIDEQIQAVNATIVQRFDEAKEKAVVDLKKQHEELTAAVKEVKKDAKAMSRLVKEAADKEFEEIKAAHSERAEGQDKKTFDMVSDVRMALDRTDQAVSANKELGEEQLQNARAQITDNIEVVRKDAEDRLDFLAADADRLRSAISEVENLSTKRVDWVITNASRGIRPSSPSKTCLHKSYFSPRFNMAGAHGLQLEVQMYRPGDRAVPDEEAGDVAVYLWACKGISLTYRLYVGNKYQTLEKVFNGRIPYGTRRFVFLKDHINRADDTLRVSVEILECHKVIETIIEQPPEPLVPPPEGCEIERPLDGMILFHRHTNNRVMDQVKNQIDVMRSRMVRKVEWKVEQGNRLRSCFPQGDAICSALFNAAGLEGLQLLFYPSGYKGAGDGFCSLFVYGPSGCTIKCTLIVGSQRREASHCFEEPGAFGRVNFCRFDAVLDSSDNSVMVGLEIEAAHQDSVAKVAHPSVTAGDKRTQAQIDGTQANAIKSVVKLQGTPGKPMEGLDETCVLPSLWTAAFPDGQACDPDGMHPFEDLKPAPRGGRGGRRAAPSQQGSASPGSPAGLRASDSAPAMSPDASPQLLRASGEGTPLPQLSRTTSGFERGGIGAAAPGRRGPRRSGLASTTQSSLGVTAC